MPDGIARRAHSPGKLKTSEWTELRNGYWYRTVQGLGSQEILTAQNKLLLVTQQSALSWMKVEQPDVETAMLVADAIAALGSEEYARNT